MLSLSNCFELLGGPTPPLLELEIDQEVSQLQIDDCLVRLKELAASVAPEAGEHPLVSAVDKALSEDLNVSQAWGAIFDWVRDCNRSMSTQSLTPSQAASAVAAWGRVDAVLGLGIGGGVAEVSNELETLLAERQAARKAKDFKRSDAIRDELKARGWVIEDTPSGPRLKKL